MIGEILLDRYEILAKIGDGGMALVYRAKDTLLNRHVAVKVLREQFATDSQFIERFRQEAQAAASLSHPNVVNIYDVGHTGTTHFIVMEYVEGKNLSEIIKDTGILDEECAISIGTQISSALNHAHQHRIIHRDIKPHNILITHDHRVKVTDFGIAAISSVNITQTGMVLGSVHYFSPEQARGTRVDNQSDLYSLGIVLYEMLTGKVPFRGDTPISIALKQIQDQPIPPRQINPDVSVGLERIVLTLLAKQPTERYQSAEHVVNAMQKLPTDNTMQLSHEQTQQIPVFSGEKDEVKNSVTPKSRTGKKKQQQQKHRIYTILIIFTLLFGLVWAIQRIVPSILFPQEVTVPNIVGLDRQEAEGALRSRGLNLGIDIEVFDNKVPAGHIISQEPAPNRAVKQNRTILVRLSKGPEFVEMPTVEGLSLREARLNLTQAGFILGDETELFDPDIMINTVVSQQPIPGERVKRGTPVDLVVSKGHETQILIPLPDFRGQNLESVRDRLVSLGLSLGNAWPEFSTTVPQNQIIEQNPPPGSDVELGWAIDFVYSQGLPRGTEPPIQQDEHDVQRWTTESVWRSAEVRINIPEGPVQEVVILVVDDFGAREIYRQTHSGGTSINRTVQGRGDGARIQVYIGGRMFLDKQFQDL